MRKVGSSSRGPINFTILPDVELATDDWGCLYIEQSGFPKDCSSSSLGVESPLSA